MPGQHPVPSGGRVPPSPDAAEAAPPPAGRVAVVLIAGSVHSEEELERIHQMALILRWENQLTASVRAQRAAAGIVGAVAQVGAID